MKVYIVTSGYQYSYKIEKVFTKRKQAELFCAKHVGCDIEEYEADEEVLEGEKIYYGISGFFYMNEDKVMETWQMYSRTPIDESIEVDSRGMMVTIPTDKVYSFNKRRAMLNEYRAGMEE